MGVLFTITLLQDDSMAMVKTAISNNTYFFMLIYLKGVGFQWSGKKAIPIISKEYPHLKYVQTESECGNGANIWSQAEYTWSLMHQYLYYLIGMGRKG